jgi:hypothetical protein
MLFPNEAYDNDTVALMGRAFDGVLADMRAAGVFVSPAMSARIARRILEDVADGERDINGLILDGFEAADAFRS